MPFMLSTQLLLPKAGIIGSYTAYYTVLSKIMILFYVFTKSIDLRILARDTELYQQVLESVRLTS